jgi:MFS family permease
MIRRTGRDGLTGYGTEFRTNGRALLGATIGLGSGLSINGYGHSVIAPYLLTEFGWSKAQLAMLGSLYILCMVSIPLAGRLADVLGVRLAILLGLVFYPASWIGLSLIHGDIRL